MIYWKLFWIFTKVAFLSWGGGPASLALMQRETVAAGWTTPSEFADAVAVGNSLPGPIAPQVSAFIGYQMAGFWGAVASAVGTVVPTTLLMLAVVGIFVQIKESTVIKAMLQAVRPVVVGFLLWTAYDMAVNVFKIKTLGWTQAAIGGWDKVAIAIVTFVALTFTSINPAIIIGIAAVFGWLVYGR